jgi:protein-S-isoprenylcysteine O-methyltransferase Ste14
VTRARAAAGSLLFLLVAPGVMAGVVPWLLTGWESTGPSPALVVLGVLLIVAGVTALVSAFARFVTEGLGTPAPIAPPGQLVVGGLYRHVRNPMYVAVLATIVGQAALLGQMDLLTYALGFLIAVVSFVYGYEQPRLHGQFGAQYDEYCEHVPAWVPRLRPWEG